MFKDVFVDCLKQRQSRWSQTYSTIHIKMRGPGSVELGESKLNLRRFCHFWSHLVETHVSFGRHCYIGNHSKIMAMQYKHVKILHGLGYFYICIVLHIGEVRPSLIIESTNSIINQFNNALAKCCPVYISYLNRTYVLCYVLGELGLSSFSSGLSLVDDFSLPDGDTAAASTAVPSIWRTSYKYTHVITLQLGIHRTCTPSLHWQCYVG